jgi:RecA/RadA recombinase
VVRPFDLSKLRKKIDKSILGLSHGFNDPTTWLDTGCFALNYLVSGRFDAGIPVEGKFTMFAGDSGSGKSYIATANLIKDCQKRGIFVVVIDTENALDESWLAKFGVDTSDGALEKISAATIDDTSEMLGELIELYKAQNADKPYAERPRMLIIIDSLGMLITPTQLSQFMEGDQKGDLGIKAKQITNMIRVMMSKIASQPIGLIATNHVYDSQDKYKPDNISGGKMLEFATSIIVQMNKHLLKEDEEGVKLAGGEVAGIRSTVVVRKSRYAKPFEKVYIDIPYDTGMDPYSGLFDLFQKKGVIEKAGNRWSYTSPETGEIVTEYRKQFKAKGILDQIMADWAHWEKADTTPVGVDTTEAGLEGITGDEV